VILKFRKILIAFSESRRPREREAENRVEEKESRFIENPVIGDIREWSDNIDGTRWSPRGIPNSHANKPIYFGEPTSND